QRPPVSTLFPYTTLFRSGRGLRGRTVCQTNEEKEETQEVVSTMENLFEQKKLIYLLVDRNLYLCFMETKEKIVTEAITFITTRGTNAFSYKDISKEIGITTSSIHYYFPTKNDLIVAVLEHVIQKNKEDRKRNNYSNMKSALRGYIDEHVLIREQNKVSVIAALAADINTLEPQIKAILNNYIEEEIDYLAQILNKGEKENLFVYKATPRIQALMILTNLLAISRISMITKEIYFEDVARQIIIDIEKK